MNKSFLNALDNTKKQISDIYFLFKTRTKPAYFTRNSAKMSFIEATHFILRNICKSLQIDLNDFFEEFKKSGAYIIYDQTSLFATQRKNKTISFY